MKDRRLTVAAPALALALGATMFALLAAIALLLASVGLHAVTAHGVTQRTQEIGIRVSFGARSRQVVWLLVRRTFVQLVMDGKDHPALFGRTAAWKQIVANTWETVNTQNGKLFTTDTTRLSPDGRTLTVNTKGPKPAGGTFEQTVVYERISGGPGLAGRWKTKNLTTSAPTIVELVPSGADGLTVRIPDFKIAFEAKFDGKDYPATGSEVPPGLTLAIQKTGPRSFDMTEKLNGKPIFKLSFAVSADGKTLTETGGAIGLNEPFKAVYDRQ